MNRIIREARILVIEDNEENLALIEHMLRRGGYRSIQCSADSRQAIALIESERPDLLILDLIMPPPDGFAILDQLALSVNQDQFMAVLALTADTSSGPRMKALSKGARDFLTNPIDRIDLLTRTRSLLEWRFARNELEAERAKRQALERSLMTSPESRDLLDRLAVIAACLDPERAEAGRRVAELSAQIATELNLDESGRKMLKSAARLYDFGFLMLPEAIRNSRVPLTADERLSMTRHTVAAQQMFSGGSPALEMTMQVGLSHHERWDGGGYPNGRKGTDTPLPARIVGVAQVYDALVTPKPYRPALPSHEAIIEIQRQSGYAFDPDVVDAFLRVMAGECENLAGTISSLA
jgi:putative two-component system response regulator